MAPAKEYLDKLTRKPTAPVTTGQIYWGAVPFVVIQLIMVGVLITFPGLVTSGLTKSTVDPSKIEIQIPAPDSEGEQRERDANPPDFGSGSREKSRQAPARGDSGAKQGTDLEDLFKQSK